MIEKGDLVKATREKGNLFKIVSTKARCHVTGGEMVLLQRCCWKVFNKRNQRKKVIIGKGEILVQSANTFKRKCKEATQADIRQFLSDPRNNK